MKHVVVALIQNKDGAFLSLSRPKGKEDGVFWSFPGGKIEDGETMKDALVREVKEESSIICLPDQKIGERPQPERNQLVHYWRCQYISGEPKDPESGEVANVAFRSVDELLELIPIENIHECVRAKMKLSL